MPTTVFQSTAIAGNYNIVSNGSGYTFPLSLVSGSLPGSNVNISAVSMNISQTYQFSNRRLAVIRNEATGADLCAAFTTSGNSATSNVNEALNLSMYTTLGLYCGYNPLTIRVRGAGKGTSSSDGNVMSIRDGAIITLTITWEYSFTKCTPPTVVTLSASVSEGSLNLNFSGASGGTNNPIWGYKVQYRESDDNASWGAWADFGTYQVASGSGSISVSPSGTQARYRQFQICTLGEAGEGWESGYVLAGSVRRNSAPAAPGVTAPVASTIIYNSQPRILATVGNDADGHSQTLAASGYTASSGGAQAPGKKLVLRRSSALSPGGQSVSVASTDALGVASGMVARSFTYSVPSWTDPSLVAGDTSIKAVHMTELRAAINNVRAYYGMAAYPWAQAITAGTTALAGWTGHVQEMRTAIEQVAALVNGWDTGSSTYNITLPAWIAIPQNTPSAAVIAQLRSVIPTL